MFKKMVLTCALLGVAVASRADSVVTLPDTGIDMTGYIGAGILVMGSVAAAAVGGYAAFLVIKKALRWLGRALG